MQDKAANKIISVFEMIYAIIMSIGIMLAAFFLAMDTVNAEDYELQPFDSSFYEYIDTIYHITGSQTIFSELTDVPENNWQYVEVSNNNDVLGFIYNDNRLDVSNFSVTSNSYNTNELRYVTWDGRQSMCSTYDLNYSNVVCYLLDYKVGNYGTRIYKINFGTKSYINGSSNPYTKCSVTRTMIYTYNWQSFNSESVYGIFNLTDTLKFYNYRPTFGYCDTPYGWWTAIGTGNKGTHIELQHRPNNSTVGLKVYKQTIHNQSFLYVDFSDLIEYDATYDYQSSVFGNINIDGMIYELDYDNSSPYYHNERNTEKIYYQIPFSSLSLTDPEIEVATLEDLEVDLSVNNHLMENDYTFYWLDRLYLIGSPHDNGGFTPDSSSESPQIIINDNSQTINEYNTAIYNSHSADGFNFYPSQAYFSDANKTGTEKAYDSIQGKFTGATIECYIYDDGTVLDGSNQIFVRESNSIPNESDATPLMQYLYDNAFGLYYDVIICDIYDYEYTDTPTHYSYYASIVIYGELYYVKNGINSFTFSLKDIIQYDKACSDYLYKLYDVSYKKLGSIDTNIAEYFNLEGTRIEQIILGIENINNILPDMKDLLKNILDALHDLDIEPTDTTAIENKLDDIYTRLGNSNLNNDWYAGYRDWLYGETDNNVVDTPHEWFVDKLNDVKSIYDIFGNTTLHTYYTHMRRLISGITGNDISLYYNYYFDNGIRDNLFDLHTFSSYNEGGFQ